MASDESPLTMEALEGRRFAFYPAIRGVEHNEWVRTDSTWSEIHVRNCESGQEFWIAKSHLGEVSSTGAPVLILGLVRELEAKAGGVHPYRRVVTEMPAARAGRAAGAPIPAAPPPKQRLFSRSDLKAVRILALSIGGALVLALLALLSFVGGFRSPLELFEADTTTADQRYLGLAGHYGYFEVVGRLGDPEDDLWISDDEAELQFQALGYPSRGYTVILMGGSRAEMRYLGTVHEPSRRVLDSARLERGGDTSSLMRNLPEF